MVCAVCSGEMIGELCTAERSAVGSLGLCRTAAARADVVLVDPAAGGAFPLVGLELAVRAALGQGGVMSALFFGTGEAMGDVFDGGELFPAQLLDIGVDDDVDDLADDERSHQRGGKAERPCLLGDGSVHPRKAAEYEQHYRRSYVDVARPQGLLLAVLTAAAQTGVAVLVVIELIHEPAGVPPQSVFGLVFGGGSVGYHADVGLAAQGQLLVIIDVLVTAVLAGIGDAQGDFGSRDLVMIIDNNRHIDTSNESILDMLQKVTLYYIIYHIILYLSIIIGVCTDLNKKGISRRPDRVLSDIPDLLLERVQSRVDYPKYLFKRPLKPAPCLASSLAIS